MGWRAYIMTGCGLAVSVSTCPVVCPGRLLRFLLLSEGLRLIEALTDPVHSCMALR